MFIRAFIYLTGFGFTIAGGVSCIAYLNIIPWGNTLIDYFLFVSSKPECYLFVIGLMMMFASFFYPVKRNHTNAE